MPVVRPLRSVLLAFLIAVVAMAQIALAAGGTPGTVLSHTSQSWTYTGLGSFSVPVSSQITTTYNAESAYATDPTNWSTSAGMSTTAPQMSMLGTLGMIFGGNLGTVINGFKDVWNATSQAQNGQNLSSPNARAAFYAKQGFYQKYTPQQIQLINTVVFPAVHAARLVTTVGSLLWASVSNAITGPYSAGGLNTGAAATSTGFDLAGLALYEYNLHKRQMQRLHSGQSLLPTTTVDQQLLGNESWWTALTTGNVYAAAGVYGNGLILYDNGGLGLKPGAQIGAPVSVLTKVQPSWWETHFDKGFGYTPQPSTFLNIPGLLSVPTRTAVGQMADLINLDNAWQIPLPSANSTGVPIPTANQIPTTLTRNVTITESLIPAP